MTKMNTCPLCGEQRKVIAGALICSNCDLTASLGGWSTEDELQWLKGMLMRYSPGYMRACYAKRRKWGEINRRAIEKALARAEKK